MDGNPPPCQPTRRQRSSYKDDWDDEGFSPASDTPSPEHIPTPRRESTTDAPVGVASTSAPTQGLNIPAPGFIPRTHAPAEPSGAAAVAPAVPRQVHVNQPMPFRDNGVFRQTTMARARGIVIPPTNVERAARIAAGVSVAYRGNLHQRQNFLGRDSR
jgi:hypothetical protein